MQNKWPTVRLADVCESIDYGFTAASAQCPKGPKLLRITDIVQGFINWESVPYCETIPDDINRYRLRSGEIVIARTGASTGASMLISNPPEAVFASYLIRLKMKEIADSKFIYYTLKLSGFWDYMRGVLGDKSAQPNASAKTIAQAPVPLPPLPIQKCIAHILGTLDDKIELNRRMNETLEAMARAIFQSWFIDFDPVHAKAAGRNTGLPKPIADLFPSEFQNSELGLIPKGWRVGRIEDAAKINRQSIQRNYPHRVIEYVDISSVNAGRLSQTTRYHRNDAPGRAQRLVSHGDTIWSCVRPNRRSFLFIQAPLENLVASTGFVVLTPQTVTPSYLYGWTTTDEFVDYLTANADGSAYPAVRPDCFAQAAILIPAQGVLAAYEKITAPPHAAISRNEYEHKQLAQTRDELLPKLLSGEISMPKA